jgi:Rrf2 family protein
MLSNACKYAIRAILYLAINSDETKRIGAKKIAEDLETPKPFLAKLLQELSTNKLISSVKGPYGGFFLTDEDKQHHLWDVIVCIDGGHKFDQCFLGLSHCDNKNPCPIHHIASPFKEKLLNEFKNKTIDDFVEEIKREGTLISLKALDI